MEFINEHWEKEQLYDTRMMFVNNGLKDPDDEIIKLFKDNGVMNRKGEIHQIRMITFISKKLAE